MSESEQAVTFDIQAMQAILLATFIVGISAISSLVSYATLIFSGTCPNFLAAGVALFFLAGCIIPIIFFSIFMLSRNLWIHPGCTCGDCGDYCRILGGDASKCQSENHFFQSVCRHCTFNDTDRYLLCVFRIF